MRKLTSGGWNEEHGCVLFWADLTAIQIGHLSLWFNLDKEMEHQDLEVKDNISLAYSLH